MAGGAAPFTAATAVGAAVTSAVANGAQYLITQAVNKERVKPLDLGISVGLGGAAGGIAGPVTTSARAAMFDATSHWLDKQTAKMIVSEGIAEKSTSVASLGRSLIGGLTSNQSSTKIKDTIQSALRVVVKQIQPRDHSYRRQE